MRICFVSFHYSARLPSDPTALLDELHLRRELPAQLMARGHEVHSIQRFVEDEQLSRLGVQHHFVRGVGVRNVLATARRLEEIDPDVVHVHGIKQRLNLLLLRLTQKRPIVVHFHGGEPSTRLFGAAVERILLSPAERFLMTTGAQCRQWQAALGRPDDAFVLFPEGSSPFTWKPREEARSRTGMSGSPIFLAVSRLDPIKDPMTVIKGFAEIVGELPEARLYWYYSSAPMIEQVRLFVESNPALRSSVELRGQVPHASLEDVFNSADFFLQGSVREYSSFALLDAMACGVVPILSDIPSFRALADDTACYFPVGESAVLAQSAVELASGDFESQSQRVRKRFEQELSFSALAERLESIYRDVLQP